ncbi:hypothetical protein T07_8907 [Trichinella nelsoni]|uniref:Uncharacterized protein n=1 Tax=Trichinella nelsoni TaxID=6336 RepID=A0A0V0RVE5_9BILA|nr:hypothetical protein T07_8907 [Trichinella nelsoni]
MFISIVTSRSQGGSFVTPIVLLSPSSLVDDAPVRALSLAPRQKMDAYRTYVLLRLTFQLMIAKFNNIKQSAGGYNHAILRLVKRCFQLLVETSTNFIRALRLCGGLGVFSLLELYATAKVSRAFKMLWSPQSYYCHHHYYITIDDECEMKDTFIGAISPFDLKYISFRFTFRGLSSF